MALLLCFFTVAFTICMVPLILVWISEGGLRMVKFGKSCTENTVIFLCTRLLMGGYEVFWLEPF